MDGLEDIVDITFWRASSQSFGRVARLDDFVVLEFKVRHRSGFKEDPVVTVNALFENISRLVKAFVLEVVPRMNSGFHNFMMIFLI